MHHSFTNVWIWELRALSSAAATDGIMRLSEKIRLDRRQFTFEWIRSAAWQRIESPRSGYDYPPNESQQHMHASTSEPQLELT